MDTFRRESENMARISRVRKQEFLQIKETAIRKSYYRTALYIRVSILDGGRQGSDTVKTQELFLRKFIEEKPEFLLTYIYTDNGESGVNFQRSSFKQMIEDIKKEKINCIIVKDLSRFGINYMEAGEYIEKIFPLMGVRFIAVNDCYDSEAPGAKDLFGIHLKNLVNDSYARDISQKICPVLRAKQENGEFIGSWAAYGYKKSEESKYKLVIDEESACVVKKIFQWRLWGMSYQSIARNLDQLEIPSPERYRYKKGVHKNEKAKEALWRAGTIGRILENQVYLGHMVQRKTKAALWKGEVQTKMPKEQWIIVKNTHESLINELDFEKVQKMRKEKSNYIFRGEKGRII